jgi:hypothetical protein
MDAEFKIYSGNSVAFYLHDEGLRQRVVASKRPPPSNGGLKMQKSKRNWGFIMTRWA